MINQDQFELHEHIIDWLMEHGTSFMEAMSIVSYACQTGRSIPEAYFELYPKGWVVRDENKAVSLDHEKKENY